MNKAPDHVHGYTRRMPQAKGEFIYHLEKAHPESVRVPFERHRWTRAALEDFHRTIHQAGNPQP